MGATVPLETFTRYLMHVDVKAVARNRQNAGDLVYVGVNACLCLLNNNQ